MLLTVITGGINDRNDIGLPPAIARQIEAVDPNALEVFKTKMGLRFDAGPEVVEGLDGRRGQDAHSKISSGDQGTWRAKNAGM